MNARRTRRPQTLPIGTYAEGTCRAEDRIDALLPELQALHLSRADRAAVTKLAGEYANRDDDGETAFEQLDDILDDLCTIAESYLPPYTYLGNLEGDGACFGVWASVEALQDAVREGEVWEATDDHDGRTYRQAGATLTNKGEYYRTVPKGQLYMVVSDHGNVSLYQSRGGKQDAREIWGVV